MEKGQKHIDSCLQKVYSVQQLNHFIVKNMEVNYYEKSYFSCSGYDHGILFCCLRIRSSSAFLASSSERERTRICSISQVGVRTKDSL